MPRRAKAKSRPPLQPGEDPADPIFNVDRAFAIDPAKNQVLYRSRERGWMPITLVNVYRLLELQDEVVRAGKKHSRLWYALDQEIKRRKSAGELKAVKTHAA